ncbi:hypothetical protein [Nocardioides sp. SR21]|uniref:hypothetical protein n=1 Tax=Nocardioides sp. SR21 TaxID=2919501 RepID=UPI001FAA63A0|nr:hypothetical protein [Nocardioides sp. SR21]
MKNSVLTRSIAVAAVATLGLGVSATAANAADAVAPSFDLAVPTTLHAGASATPFAGHLSTPDGAQDIWVRTSITGADADDVHVEWKDAQGTWAAMPTTAIDGGIQVTFGDGDADANGVKGFSTPAGYTADTDFRIAVDHDAAHGNLAWTSELVTGDAGTVVGSESGTVAITADPTFTMDVPSTLVTGAATTGFTGHLSAPDGAQDIWVRTSITGAAADAVTVEWKDAAGTWAEMPKTAVGGGFQTGFGDGDADANGVRGFSVPAGYTADTDFRIKVAAGAPAGTLTWVSELVTGDAGTVLRSTSGSVDVDLPVAAKAAFGTKATAVVVGKQVRFSGTLLDANHADAPLAGRTVTVYREIAGVVTVADTATTDEHGAFAVTLPATATASYWAESGDQVTDKVEVRAAKQLSSVSASAKRVAKGKKVRFTGVVIGSEKGQVVQLQKLRANGTWKTVTTTVANRAGAFKIASALPMGTKSYRLAVPTSTVLDGDTSRVLVITVK